MHSHQSKLGSVAILVISCDKYADLWPLFFKLFRRFWPDCPFPQYLVSNFRDLAEPGVINLRTGTDKSWSSNVLAALDQIEEDYVLMTLDDLFLVGPVDTRQILATFSEFIATDGQCLKLNPIVSTKLRQPGRLDLTPPGTTYRTSTVLTLWSRSVLQSLLVPSETAWEFELNGSKRSDAFTRFYTTNLDHFQFVNGVIKGNWSRVALRKLQHHAAMPAVLERGILTWWQEICYQLALFRSKLFLRSPIGTSRKIHSWFRQIRGKSKGAAYSPQK